MCDPSILCAHCCCCVRPQYLAAHAVHMSELAGMALKNLKNNSALLAAASPPPPSPSPSSGGGLCGDGGGLDGVSTAPPNTAGLIVASNDRGETPLHKAAIQGHLRCIMV